MDNKLIALLVLYIPILLTSICGNSLFICVVWRNRGLHTPVYLLLANESGSDIIFAFLTVFAAIQAILGRWILGDILCRVIGMLAEASFSVSIISLMVVAVERYLLICGPNKKTKLVSWSLKASALIWIVSVIMASPLLYGHGVVTYNTSDVAPTGTKNSTIEKCSMKYWSKTFRVTYTCLQTFIIYLIPLVVMLISHLKIRKTLFGQKFPSNFPRIATFHNATTDSTTTTNTDTTTTANTISTPATNNKSSQSSNGSKITDVISSLKVAKSLKRKCENRKIANLLMVINLTFFVCWTPWVIVRIMTSFIELNPLIWKSVELLTLLSTVPNFFITFFLSREFRKMLKALLGPYQSKENKSSTQREHSS